MNTTAAASGIQLVAMVSVYKSSRWLRRRLENLFATHIYKRGQLLIYCANATSPDPQDDAIICSYAGRPNLAYRTIPFCTVYATWNWIVGQTSSPYLTNANSDDLVAPDCYDVLIAACERDQAVLAHCDWYSINHDVASWEQAGGKAGNGHPYRPPNHMSCGHFPLWRRSLHDQIGLFDPNMRALGDADFWHRAWLAGIRNFTYVNAPLAAYQWRGAGETGNLWYRTPEDVRCGEWRTIASRKPGKLTF